MAMMVEITGAVHEIAKDGHIHRERIKKAAKSCPFYATRQPTLSPKRAVSAFLTESKEVSLSSD